MISIRTARSTLLIVAIGVFTAITVIRAEDTESVRGSSRKPIAYDATDHAEKPEDPPARMADITLTSRWWFLDHECGPNDKDGSCTAESSTLRETHFRRALRGDHGPGAAGARCVVLNLEVPGWETGGWDRENGNKPSLMSTAWKQQAREAMRRWARALRIAHQELPDAEIGVYRMFPIRNYWAPVKFKRRNKRGPLNRWRNANSFLAGEDVTYRVNGQQYNHTIPELIDFVSPSLYEFYPRPDRWEVYAGFNLVEAEKFGSDVRPFIWPKFHPGGSGTGTLPEDHWRRIVSFIGKKGYSPIIWNSDDRTWPKGGPMWYNVLMDELDE